MGRFCILNILKFNLIRALTKHLFIIHMYKTTAHVYNPFDGKKSVRYSFEQISLLETRAEIRFIGSFSLPNVGSFGRKFASALLADVCRVRTVHPCNNRGSYTRAFETRLQPCETARSGASERKQ